MKNTILKVENLNVKLGGEVVLENINFNLREKEVLVILGPNGAGKSVLLKTLLSFFSFEGLIQWRQPVHIGYVPEAFIVSKTLPLSVKEFFQFKDVSLEKISESLGLVGIDPSEKFLEKRLGTLSSGQLRRTLIGWAMVDEPDIILLDEPMVGIDIHGRETIYDSLVGQWLKKGQAIILVSHEIGEVCKKADKVLALNKKRLFYGKPQEVITSNNLAKIYGASISI